MPKEKKGTLAVRKVEKPVPAVGEPQPSSIQEILDTIWDPFRGFEWPVEYELPTRIPLVDVIDSGNEYVVKAELPGLKKGTLKVDVGTNELSLSAESDVEREEKGKVFLHRERAFSTFRRNIGFAQNIDTEKVSVSMAGGMLEIKLPKLVPIPEKKTKRITL